MVAALMEEKKDMFKAEFRRFEKSRQSKGPAWLESMRTQAIERFVSKGLPTTREEDWRYTNVAALGQIPFELAARQDLEMGGRDIREISCFGVFHSTQLVFVNGHFAPGLSSLQDLPAGIEVGSLAARVQEGSGNLSEILNSHAAYGKSPFSYLNTAFMQDGAYVRIRRGTVLDHPIHLIFISTASEKAVMSYPRTLIVAEPSSQATVLESFIGMGETTHFTNAVTELIAQENAVLEHYKVQQEGPQGYHVGNFYLRLGRNSQVAATSISVGGLLCRNDVHALLDAEGADLALNGLYLTRGKQHVDNHTVIDHAKPHGNSRELYLGLLDGKSRGVFDGKIFVRADAQKTVSRQTNKNLLLSDEALVNTKPQLEINADDVKCNHGATIGQLDENSLFYLRSRGIGASQAHAILTYAFANELVSLIKVDALRAWLEGVLVGRLQEGKSS